MSFDIEPFTYMIRARDVTNDRWGSWRPASFGEANSVRSSASWQVKDLFAMDDLLGSDMLREAVEEAAWNHPDEAPYGEPLLIMLGTIDNFTRARRRIDGLWISSCGLAYPPDLVTAWKRVVKPAIMPPPKRVQPHE